MSARRRVVLAAAAAGLLLLLPAAAFAKTFEPTRKDDPAPNGCKPNNCSLREAVIAANNRGGKDAIRLRGGTPYRLEIPLGGMFQEDRIGDLDLEGRTTLVGAGASKTTLDAEEVDRAIQINRASTVKGLTITDGSARNGGGIFVSSSVNRARLDNLVVVANKASELGGGIFTQALELVITRTAVTGNFSAGHGGGLGAPGADVSSHTRLLRSAVTGNDSDGVGGGIALSGPPPNTAGEAPILNAVNSTIAENDSLLNGGGISATFGNAEANLDNVTVAGNRADADGNDSGEGGGMHEFAGEINSFDSVIAANGAPATTSPGSQCLGDFVGTASVLQNQVQPVDGCFPSAGFTPTDDAKLDPLDDYGGPTETVRLQSGSPAIGLAEDCPKVDQRGKPRPPVDCDAGAFERKGP